MGDDETGFTVVEVMVAIVLLSMVLVAGGSFMIRTMYSSASMAGRQGAVAVAGQQLEKIRSITPTFDAAGVSPLVYGRTQSAVQTQWADAAAAGLDVGTTYTGSGSTVYDAKTYDPTGQPVTVPLTQTVSVGNQAYTVATLIGTCAATDSSACIRGNTGNTLFRVVVRVTWRAASGGCAGGVCSYSAGTLIDPTAEPVFNTNRRPVANPDTASVATGASTTIGVVANDSGSFAPLGAVTIISDPGHGTATVSPSSNIVTYTPAARFSGPDAFSYTVTDTSGLTSAVATVVVTVTPVGVADALSVTAAATAATVAVLTNDLATGPSLTSITTPPAIGTAVISGTGIQYTPPAAASGIATITYTATDSAQQTYTGVLTVTVKPKVVNPTCSTALAGSRYSFGPVVTGTGPYTVTVTGYSGAATAPTTQNSPVTIGGLVAGESVTYTVKGAGGATSDPLTFAVNASSTC
jgi:large repetitive protein